MPKEDQFKISATARAIIQRVTISEPLEKFNHVTIAYLYCFTNPLPLETGSESLTTEFRLAGDILIDFYMKKGIVMHDSGLDNFVVSGVPIGRTQVIEKDIERFTFGLVPGFRLNPHLHLEAPMVQLKTLLNERSSFNHGDMRRVFIGGREYTATRDVHIGDMALKTIRHIVSKSYQTHFVPPLMKNNVAIKRPLLTDLGEVLHGGKRQKID